MTTRSSVWITPLCLLLAAAAQAAPPVVREPPPAGESPMLMNTGAHLKAVCDDAGDIARQLVCVSWLNGAAQVNRWFRTRNPVLLPDHCPPAGGSNLADHRAVVLSWLEAHPAELNSESIVVYRKAMAAAYPCTQG